MPRKSPFLSVVVRTQFKRLDLLEEAFLCLQGQTNQDFEVILVVHGEVSESRIQKFISSLNKNFRDKFTLQKTSGGTRAKPLNVGISLARGEYVSFFDDDDLLDSEWVNAFYEAAQRFPGTLLRARCATLPAAIVGLQDSKEDHATQLEQPRDEYSHSFSFVDHILVSHTPFMSLSFPIDLFKIHGLHADEELQVCEDWDLLLQSANIVPVSDIDQVTAYYRRWKGLRTSYELHQKEVWDEAEERVIQKFVDKGVVFRGKDISRLQALLAGEREAFTLRQKAIERDLIIQSISWKITKPLRAIRRKISRNAGRG